MGAPSIEVLEVRVAERSVKRNTSLERRERLMTLAASISLLGAKHKRTSQEEKLLQWYVTCYVALRGD